MFLFQKPLTLKLVPKLVTSSRFASNPLSLFKSWSSTFTETIEQAEEEEEKKAQTQDLLLHDISRTMSTDLNDYKIIKEGEAEILMHAKNEVFYNKAQVNNRDISIAVLRTFISKRKQEHEAYLSKRTKGAQKASENDSSELVVEEVDHKTPSEDHKSNGECELEQEISPAEPCSTMEGSVKINEECDASKDKIDHLEVKGQRELKPPRVLEALSASGLRALRYACEVEGIGQVVALDNDKASVEACRRNIKFNGSVAVAKVESHLADARVYMLTHPKEFDVVDLDPYGSPSVFLDSAVQSVADGGILMCTATDMAVLCGGNGEVCYSKYGSYPLRGKYCHEMALRIVLASIESHANRYKRYIVPVLSVQMDFYLCVFVRVYTSANAMKNTPLKLSYVYQCTGCDSFHLQPIGRTISKNTSVRYLPGHGPVVPQECSDCGKKFNMGGPIWSAPIHDQEWVTSILADVKRMKDSYPAFDRISAVLTTISEELPDVPLYLSLHNLCSTLKCTSPSAIIFRSAVINAGYCISGTHVNPLGLKSDAPMDVIWDIMRCWVKNHPVKAQPADQPGSIILAKEPVLQVKNHPVKAQPADEPGSILAKEPVLQIIKEAANIASTGIAFDPVTRDNYLDWSTCVKGHLVGQDLWNNVVEGDLDVNYPNWKSKDAQALHAIRLACGYQARVRIQKCKTAKEAWSNLNVIFNKDLIANIDVIEEECPQNDVDRLHQAINKGLWDRASSIIRDAPNIICKQSPSTGYTALHVAVSVGNKRIMRELVAKDRASLTEKDTRGYTPLALVASKSIEEKDIAEWLVTEGGIDMLDMEIEAAEGPGKGDIPVLLAAANGHKEITRYLFFKANWVWYSLFNNNCFYADKLLRHCIHAEIFDVAAALLKYNPLLRHTFDTQLSLCYMKPIYELACKPTVFPSGTRLNPFQHIIYKVLLVPMQMEIEGKRESNTNLAAKICKFMRSLAGAITGFLIKLPGIKKIYETKINHYLVNEILKSFCERIKKIPSQSKLHQLSVQDAMLQAAKNGIVEFIRSMGKANPDLLRVVDTNKRGIMAHAILNRQKEVFNLIYEIQDRTELITPIDVIGNNLLHLAADLGLSPSHDHGSNAALEMQKEHQWFKEVESNVPPMYKEAKNSYDIKPGELFTTSHKQLVKDGCEWAKGRPAPFIVIGTFIMTFSIGTAFRMHEEPFSYVMVAIALSFITSLTSVLAFTSIITSSYAEKDFIKSLPITFFFGVVNNFLSLVFLVWAFGAILSVELKEHVWMAIAGITYVFIGVVMFMCSLWPYANSICLLLPRCLRRVLYVAN